ELVAAVPVVVPVEAVVVPVKAVVDVAAVDVAFGFGVLVSLALTELVTGVSVAIDTGAILGFLVERIASVGMAFGSGVLTTTGVGMPSCAASVPSAGSICLNGPTNQGL